MRTLKAGLSTPFLALLILVVNAASTYLVPLIADIGIPSADVPLLQGFVMVVLSGIAAYLATEEQETAP